MEHQESTEYITLDLDLESEQDMSPLVDHFGEEVFVLYNGQIESVFYTSFEPKYFEPEKHTPEKHALLFLKLIGNLTNPLREMWNSCQSKIFDFGFRSGFAPRPYRIDLSQDTLQGIANVGAILRISIYPVEGAPNHAPVAVEG